MDVGSKPKVHMATLRLLPRKYCAALRVRVNFVSLSDTIARQTMALTGATEQDIDLYFGWMERFYQAKMQIHYESRFTRTRRTAVTSQA